MYIREYRPHEVIDGRYRVEALVGKGGFSYVYRVFDTVENKGPLALKMVADDPTHQQAMLEGLNNDFEKLNRVRSCQHIIRPVRIQNHQAPFYSVLSYVDGPSLADYIRHNGPLPEVLIARCLAQIGLALEQCHSLSDPVVHLDIKPENILLDQRGDCYLSDFGTSRHLSELQQGGLDKKAFTANYVPPEVFRRQPLNKQSDIFSLGISLYEFCTGLHEHEAMPLSQSVNLRMDLDPIPDRYTKRIAQLIDMMLTIKAAERPNAALIRSFGQHFLQHGFWMDPQGRSTQFMTATEASPPPAPKPQPKPQPKKIEPEVRKPATPVIRRQPKPPPAPQPTPPPSPIQLAQRAKRRSLYRRLGAAAAVILLLSVSSIFFLSAQTDRFAILEQEVYADMERREYRQAFDHVEEAATIPFHGTEAQQLASAVTTASKQQVVDLRSRYKSVAKSAKPNFQMAELYVDSLQKCAVTDWADHQDELLTDLQFERIKYSGMQMLENGDYTVGKQTLERAVDLMNATPTIERDQQLIEKLRELIRKGY